MCNEDLAVCPPFINRPPFSQNGLMWPCDIVSPFFSPAFPYLAHAGDLLLGEPETRQRAVPRGWRAVRGRGPRSRGAVAQTRRQHTAPRARALFTHVQFNNHSVTYIWRLQNQKNVPGDVFRELRTLHCAATRRDVFQTGQLALAFGDATSARTLQRPLRNWAAVVAVLLVYCGGGEGAGEGVVV